MLFPASEYIVAFPPDEMLIVPHIVVSVNDATCGIVFPIHCIADDGFTKTELHRSSWYKEEKGE